MLFIAFLCLSVFVWYWLLVCLSHFLGSMVIQILCTRPNRRMETRRATEDERALCWLFTLLIDCLFVSSFLFCIVGHPDHLQPDRRMEARLKMSDLRSWYWLFVCFPVWHWLFAFFVFDIDCVYAFVFDIECLYVFVFNICNQGWRLNALRKMNEIVFGIFSSFVLTFTACDPLRLSDSQKDEIETGWY